MDVGRHSCKGDGSRSGSLITLSGNKSTLASPSTFVQALDWHWQSANSDGVLLERKDCYR